MWIFFALMSGIVLSLVNVIDKFIVSKLVPKPIIQVLFFGMVSLVVASIVFSVHGFLPLPTKFIWLSLLSGVLYAAMIVFYFEAISSDDVSSVIPLFKLSPLFIAILAALFLGEVFTPIKYLGVALLLIGSLMINYQRSASFKPSKTLILVMTSALFVAINQILNKYLLTHVDYWSLFGWARLGSFIVIIPLFYIYWHDFVSVLKHNGQKTVSLISLSEGLNLLSVLLITIATATGFVTLTNALGMLQPLFVLLIASILSIYFPKILKEQSNGSSILQKAVAITVMITGAVLII